MKTSILVAAVLFSQLHFSQVSLDKNKLVKEGVSYKLSDYKSVLVNPEAQQYFKKSRTNNTVGSIFGGVGGAFMGFGIARALSGGETKVMINNSVQTVKQDKGGAWALVGIGAGIVGIGIPFAVAAHKNAKKAIAIENGETTAFTPYFRLETAGNGFAFSYNF